MKIAQIIPFFAPAWGYGGPVRVCFDISRELAKRGHEVTVLTTDAYDHTKRIGKLCEVIDLVRVLRFRNVSNVLAKKANLFLPRGFKKYFRSHVKDYDLVHLHSFFTYQNIVCAKYCRKYKIPYILHLHEMPAPIPLFKKTLIKKIFNILYGKRLLRDASKILVVSSQEKKRLLSFMPDLKDKVEVVLNPISSTTQKRERSNRQKFGLKETDKVLLFLGRLGFIKGLDRLIDAFALLVRNDPSYKLIIAGPDEGEKAKLDRKIADLQLGDNVIFTGFVEGKTKEELFASSDVFVLFSYYESFSLAALEALSHNVPVCLSKDVGISEELMKYQCAAVVSDPQNPAETAQKIKWVYNERANLSKNCAVALKQFDIGKVADKIVIIYQKCIKTRSAN